MSSYNNRNVPDREGRLRARALTLATERRIARTIGMFLLMLALGYCLFLLIDSDMTAYEARQQATVPARGLRDRRSQKNRRRRQGERRQSGKARDNNVDDEIDGNTESESDSDTESEIDSNIIHSRRTREGAANNSVDCVEKEEEKTHDEDRGTSSDTDSDTLLQMVDSPTAYGVTAHTGNQLGAVDRCLLSHGTAIMEELMPRGAAFLRLALMDVFEQADASRATRSHRE